MQFNLSKPLVAIVLGLAVLTTGCAVVQKQETVPEYVEDSAITTSVKGKLLGDPTIKANGISVNTLKGMVQLSGYVQTPAEKTHAETVARGVKGVTSVKNDIIVRP